MIHRAAPLLVVTSAIMSKLELDCCRQLYLSLYCSQYHRPLQIPTKTIQDKHIWSLIAVITVLSYLRMSGTFPDNVWDIYFVWHILLPGSMSTDEYYILCHENCQGVPTSDCTYATTYIRHLYCYPWHVCACPGFHALQHHFQLLLPALLALYHSPLPCLVVIIHSL